MDELQEIKNRPDDWDNPYGVCGDDYFTARDAFEAGADAIFEFAKEEGKRDLLKEIAEGTFILREGKLIRPEVK